jgi:NADPH:quinone reductase-like Zn-dependent oxidoreductase
MARFAQFSEYGDPDVIRVVEAPAPTPGPGQLRLAVRAASVNPIDWKMVAGSMRDQLPLHLPAGVGIDVAGVVDQMGSDVSEFSVGDEVLGSSVTPSFADYALAEPASLVCKPVGVSWWVAGSLAGSGGTAFVALKRLDVKAGETLLIHGAAGGVGTFAVQLAVARGVRVIGTASPRNHEYLRKIGAVPVSYGDGLLERVRSQAPQGVDAVLDASGRGEIPLSIELTGDPARVLTLVAVDAADTGIQVHIGGAGADLGDALRDLVTLLERGRLTVPIWHAYPLAEIATALKESSAGHVAGKIVVLPWQPAIRRPAELRGRNHHLVGMESNHQKGNSP